MRTLNKNSILSVQNVIPVTDMTAYSVTVESEFSFRAGESFTSYDLFRARLDAHSRHDLVHYWRRDSRTIEGASLKTSCPIRSDLRYYSVRYACIFGGQKFETKATGAKKVRTSLRNDCPAFISLRASRCGQFLQVMAVCNVHTHEVTHESSRNLAHSKKLPPDIRQKVLELLFYGVDRKLIKQYVLTKTGKELSSKDICNLAASLKKKAEFQDMLEDPEQTAALTKELVRVVRNDKSTADGDVDEELENDMLEERLLDEVDDCDNYTTGVGCPEPARRGTEESPLEDKTHQSQDVKDLPSSKTISSRNRSRWKSNRCYACGFNNQLVRAQLKVLRARRDKLREETRILRLKKRKLQLEIDAMNQNI